jgi:hypothetical protein
MIVLPATGSSARTNRNLCQNSATGTRPANQLPSVVVMTVPMPLHAASSAPGDDHHQKSVDLQHAVWPHVQHGQVASHADPSSVGGYFSFACLASIWPLDPVVGRLTESDVLFPSTVVSVFPIKVHSEDRSLKLPYVRGNDHSARSVEQHWPQGRR